MEAKSRDERDIERNVNFHGEPALHVEVLPPAPAGGLKARGKRFARNRPSCEEGE